MPVNENASAPNANKKYTTPNKSTILSTNLRVRVALRQPFLFTNSFQNITVGTQTMKAQQITAIAKTAKT